MATPFQKNGLFYVRRRVPQDLLGLVGRTHYLKSLGTGVAADAAQLFPAANAEVTSYFQQLRVSTGSWPVVAADRIAIIDSAITRLLSEATEVQRRIANFVFIQTSRARLSDDDTADSIIAAMLPANKALFVNALVEDLTPFLPQGPLPLPVKVDLQKHVTARLGTFVTDWKLGLNLTENSARKLTPPVVQRDPNVTLTSLLAIWAKALKPSKSTCDDATSVVRDFTELFGDMPVKDLTSDDFDYFAEELRKVPAAMSRAERTLPFDQRVTLGDDDSRPKAKGATPAKKLGLVKAIMAYSLKKKHIAYNPAQALETGYRYQADARRQMTSSEVKRLFSLPIFTEPAWWEFRQEITDPTLAWVGLIGLASGSRLGEIAQAHINDVLEDDGVVALSITADDDPLLPRNVKTPGSQRVIIIHPQIVALGFLEYVAAVRATESTLLFPDVAVIGGGLRSKEVSRRLNQIVDEVIARVEVVFYSLRHTFKARARAAGVSPDIERQMTGHAPADVSGKYGLAFMGQLAAEMNKITFPMVPWDLIQTAWDDIDWPSVAAKVTAARGKIVA